MENSKQKVQKCVSHLFDKVVERDKVNTTRGLCQPSSALCDKIKMIGTLQGNNATLLERVRDVPKPTAISIRQFFQMDLMTFSFTPLEVRAAPKIEIGKELYYDYGNSRSLKYCKYGTTVGVYYINA